MGRPILFISFNYTRPSRHLARYLLPSHHHIISRHTSPIAIVTFHPSFIKPPNSLSRTNLTKLIFLFLRHPCIIPFYHSIDYSYSLYSKRSEVCRVAMYALERGHQDRKYFHIRKEICPFIEAHYDILVPKTSTPLHISL
jgi:hypothetical protein